MPTKIEKDDITGHVTTGHEWDGIRELNRPLPKWWVYIFYASDRCGRPFIRAVSVGPRNHGLLARRDRLLPARQGRCRRRGGGATARRGDGQDQGTLVHPDPRRSGAVAVAQTAGRITFAENCQPCHGAGGGGNAGYPALAAGNWIWGGKLDDIYQTVTHGIRTADPDTRQSQMPRFGADGILKPEEIQAVADLRAWHSMAMPEQDSDAGKKVFAENCVPLPWRQRGRQSRGRRAPVGVESPPLW